MSNVNANTIRAANGSLGTDIRIKNTSLYESDGGTSVTQNLVQGVVKVFACWNASGTPAYRDSFNAGSITDHGTGDQQVAFTNIMSNANFTTSGQVGNGNDNDASNSQMRRGSSANSYQRCTIQYATHNAAAQYDYAYCSLVIHGDLA